MCMNASLSWQWQCGYCEKRCATCKQLHAHSPPACGPSVKLNSWLYSQRYESSLSQLHLHRLHSCSHEKCASACACLSNFVLFFMTWQCSWRNIVWVTVLPQGSECSCLACFAALDGSSYWCFREARADCLSVCGSISEVIAAAPIRFLLEEDSSYVIGRPLCWVCHWLRFVQAVCKAAGGDHALSSVFVTLHCMLFLVRKPLSLDTAAG